MVTLVDHPMDAGPLRVDAGIAVGYERVVTPGILPVAPRQRDVLFGHRVAGVVRDHPVMAEEFGNSVLRGARDDVPADPSTRDHVQG